MFNLHLDCYFWVLKQTTSRKFLLSKVEGTPTKENPKSEYRNPKQTGDPINPKSEKFPNPEVDLRLFGIFGVSII